MTFHPGQQSRAYRLCPSFLKPNAHEHSNSSFHGMACNDNTFGPVIAAGCRASFDFTLLFEQSILSIGPSVLLLILIPPRLLQLRTRRHGVFTSVADSYQIIRIFPLIAYLALQVTLLVVWGTSGLASSTSVSLAEASIRLVDALAICVLSVAEYTRAVRPSTLLCVFLAFSAVFDAVQIRTLWLLSGEALTLAALSTSSLVIKLVILAFEVRGNKARLKELYDRLGPEQTSGIFSRISFLWLNTLLWRGFNAVLVPEELFKMDALLDTTTLRYKFQHYWIAESRTERKLFNRLFFASCRAVKRPVLSAIIPRLCQSAFNFSQPLLIARIVTFAQDANDDRNIGYGLIGATAIVYTGLAFSIAVYKHKTYRLITMVRGGLISLIYDKTIELDSGALKDGASVTLIGTDCESIAQGLVNVHEIWAAPIDIGLALYLLQREMGVACVAPVVIAVLSTLGSVHIAKITRTRQKGWVEAVQERVTTTFTLLTNIKSAKMTSLVERMAAGIETLRNVEIGKAKAFLRVDAVMNVCASAPSLLSPVATLLIFALRDDNLTSAKAFSALSIVAIMNLPLTVALSALPTFWASLACFERIEKYLLSEERKDNRLFLTSGTKSPSLHIATLPTKPGREALPMSIAEDELEDMTPRRDTAASLALVSIKQGHIGYENEASCVLRDVDLDFLPGRFYTLTGPIGSGKSTVLKTVLGETSIFQGNVSIAAPRVAYCSQEPWVLNVSIKANILGGKELDEPFYEQVLKACGLDVDLPQLPDGDGTVLGSKGMRLSGGQTKRVALARAVYSRLPLVLLDDCFSSLDTTTEALLFRRLLGRNEGLLRRMGCCVVLVTQRAYHSHQADGMLVIGPDGSIENKEPVQSLLGERLSHSDSAISDEMKSGGDSIPDSTIQDAANQGPATRPSLSTHAIRQTGDISIWGFYIAQIGPLHCAVFLLLNAVTAFFPRFAQVWVSFWVETTAQNPSENTNAIYGATYALLSVGGLVAFYSVMLYMFQVMVPRSARRLHHEQLQTTIRASYSFLSRTEPGVILNRFSQDMTLVDIELPSYAVQCFFYIFSCLAQGVLVATGIKYMAAFIPAVLAVVYVLQKFYLRTSRQLRHLELEAKSPLYSHMLETCSGLHSIRAYGWEQRFIETNVGLVDSSQKPLYALYCVQRWLNLVLGLVVAAIATLLVTLGTQLRSETSASSIGVALVNTVNFSQGLANLITAWTSLETALGAIARIKSFTTDVKHEDDLGTSAGSPAAGPPRPDLTATETAGGLEFSSASFAYEDSPPVLRDISFVIEPGMRVGICGRSGSGKSSLLLAILRMLRCTGGNITLDGQRIDAMPSAAVRAAFVVVPQTPLLLPGSVRFNLDPKSGVGNDDDAMAAVLEGLELWDTVVEQGGLDTDVDALALSHGQTRLLGIARAMLDRCHVQKHKKIVLVDEVTNGLDADATAMVMRALDRAFAGHTVVAVAHQLETIVGYDRIAVLDAGRLVEWGEPADLLRLGEGWFKGLWKES
ncbi:Canalicular multispecific organic anion transporter 1 [Colletotrichum tanaceti]|uniref:Canalicular multispecific organic anion transporter 1 n=1 Tax=Colletotrichum tanaceti TaxID=1306861 RepID=A0A4U6WZP2_9PEZI|nr:Canalicular multispecific organic anion transporter 1 [Colletotrichum tanaceti]TKW48570.1 Canalicular multispecific organic anion transporter 1 [Colletotrichum tanaceti]